MAMPSNLHAQVGEVNVEVGDLLTRLRVRGFVAPTDNVFPVLDTEVRERVVRRRRGADGDPYLPADEMERVEADLLPVGLWKGCRR